MQFTPTLIAISVLYFSSSWASESTTIDRLLRVPGTPMTEVYTCPPGFQESTGKRRTGADSAISAFWSCESFDRKETIHLGSDNLKDVTFVGYTFSPGEACDVPHLAKALRFSPEENLDIASPPGMLMLRKNAHSIREEWPEDVLIELDCGKTWKNYLAVFESEVVGLKTKRCPKDGPWTCAKSRLEAWRPLWQKSTDRSKVESRIRGEIADSFSEYEIESSQLSPRSRKILAEMKAMFLDDSRIRSWLSGGR